MKSARFVNPINGEVLKLPCSMTREQCLAVMVLIASSPTKRPADRLAALRLYMTVTGQMPKDTQGEGGSVHTLHVVVDQPTPTTQVTQ